MALLRRGVFAGALFAGLLFGAPQDAGSSAVNRTGLGHYTRTTYEREDHQHRIKAQNDMILQLVTAIVSSRMLE